MRVISSASLQDTQRVDEICSIYPREVTISKKHGNIVFSKWEYDELRESDTCMASMRARGLLKKDFLWSPEIGFQSY